jgi:hypothetical protein
MKISSGDILRRQIKLSERMNKFSKELKDFIENSSWTFAKIYAETWPHYYIVRDRVDVDLFIKLVKHIRQFGDEGPFYNKKYIYFEEDGYVYWTMGASIEETTIINRCTKENTYEYRLKMGTLPK